MEKVKCYGCNDRYPGCHGVCADYKEWKAKHDERLDAKHKYVAEKSSERRYRIDRIEKTKRR